MKLDPENRPFIIIEPPRRWETINIKELKDYRDLFYFLVLRDIKVLYAQTILGFSWAILNPLVQLLIFVIVFGKVAKIDTDGIPYALFAVVAIVPWTYMSAAMSSSAQSLVSEQGMLGKIYFPRLIYPLIPVLAKLVDFAISLLLILATLLYYGISPTWNLLSLPLFILMMISIPIAAGLWLSSLAIRFRDVKFAMSFVISLLMYSAPIVYSASSIPEVYRIAYSLNPIVGVIEGFRAALLGTVISWNYIVPGMITSVVILVGGLMYFKKTERVFADVI